MAVFRCGSYRSPREGPRSRFSSNPQLHSRRNRPYGQSGKQHTGAIVGLFLGAMGCPLWVTVHNLINDDFSDDKPVGH